MAANKIYGLLGRNISYSLSPVMHNAAFRHFDIPADYELFDIEEERIGDFFEELSLGHKIYGINVTVPYKVIIKEMLESTDLCNLDESAKLLGAVNTVKIDKNELVGFNTDGEGFYESLLDETGFDPKGKNVFVLGAGGASRAICTYLGSLGEKAPKEIKVFDVDREKLASIKTLFDEHLLSGKLAVIEEEELPASIKASELVINATPLGTKERDPLPVSPDHLQKSTVVYDLVYARETELVKTAREKGLTAVNGLGMLINQGAVAFNIWTGCPLEEIKKVMRDTVKAESGLS